MDFGFPFGVPLKPLTGVTTGRERVHGRVACVSEHAALLALRKQTSQELACLQKYARGAPTPERMPFSAGCSF